MYDCDLYNHPFRIVWEEEGGGFNVLKGFARSCVD